MKDIHKQDYAELAELVRTHTLEELRSIVNITSEDDEYIDFNFKSLVATISKYEPQYLTGWCDLWDEDDIWEDSQQMGERVMLKH